jgi:lysozyme family protein
MADFYAAYKKTMGFEGGYANDPDDSGGETYRGIARRFNPSWNGWSIVDSKKSDPNFPKCLDSIEDLQSKVKLFYKGLYWDVHLLDEYPDQEIAEEMFDTGVNMGVSRAATFLQDALNVLNKNGSIYPDIVVDGKAGAKTLDAVKKSLAYDKTNEYILKIMNIFQGQHYIDFAKNNSSQEKFMRGWLKRVQL